MINASEIMRAQLTRSLGLDKYAEIMRGDPASPSFQRAFNGYYRTLAPARDQRLSTRRKLGNRFVIWKTKQRFPELSKATFQRNSELPNETTLPNETRE